MRAAALATLLATALASLTACSPGAKSTAIPSSGAGTTRLKVLTIVVRDEPSDFGMFTATSGIRGAGNATMIAQDSLAVQDEREQRHPELATELPSTANGGWRLFPDGTMETTWRLRPNIKWHDGTAFTSDDLLFTLAVYEDAEVPNRVGVSVTFMGSGEAPDPLTFIVHWSRPFVDADAGIGPPLPRHLLDSLYRSDKSAFANSHYFTSEFIGLGPYRLVHWEPGSSMQFERFDDYWRGRPPLDRVELRFVADPNTMIANILSGNADIVLPPSVDLDALFEIRRQWEGSGNVARADATGRFRLMDPQHRPQYARPAVGTTNRLVREALYRAVDRQTLADALTNGLAATADSWIPPNHVLRPDVQSAVPQFPYDPARAKGLLSEAGWAAGPDGVLAHSSSGETFDLLLRLAQAGGASGGKEKEASIIRDNWQAVGIRTAIDPVPPARAGDREYEATVPGLSLTGNLSPATWWGIRTHSQYIASDANRWGGANKAGYINPRVDGILEQLQVTIDAAQRVQLHRQLLQDQMGDVAIMPLYWEYAPLFLARGVKDSVVGPQMGYRFFEWDKTE